MIEITIDIYGNEAEISSFKPGSCELSFNFPKAIDGFLSISGKTFVISNGRCIFKLHSISDGEHSPTLITNNGSLALPTLIKDGKTVYPTPCDDDFIRNLSKRERTLEKRVKELEDEVIRLTKSVYGTKLFN